MFLATIARSGEDNGTMESFPPIIAKVLEENKDVITDEIPKTLPPRSEVDHNIELEIKVKSPAHGPYHMDQPKLKEIWKQLKDILESGLIRPFKSSYGAPVLF